MRNSNATHLGRRRLATILAVAAIPIGVAVAPAMAEPAHPVDYQWQSDCDHNGPWQWQQNRGNWEFDNCDNGNGHWQWQGDRGNGNWMWHRDREAPAAPESNFFGSL